MCRRYGLFSGILARLLMGTWNMLRYNLVGVQQVTTSHHDQQQPPTSVQDWRTTALDGCVLDHLGKLVNEGKLDPV